MSITAVNIQMTRRQISLLAALEEELVVWAEGETRHSTPSLTGSPGRARPGSPQSPEAESSEETAEETSEG